jgi:AbrB family looped-hinge helix DNA binding protein
MMTKVTLDKAGRVVLPKRLRDELQLAAGDTLELESRAEQITLRPVRGGTPLQKERGIWVYRTGRPLTAATTDQTLRQICQERDRENREAR